MIAGAGGTYELFEPDQCLAYRVVGGSQLISLRLADRLGERVVLNAPARDIRWGDDSVEVETDASGAAGPQRRSSRCRRTYHAIRFRPALPAWRHAPGAGAFAGLDQQGAGRLRAPFWREEGLSGQGFAPYELVRELYDNSPPSASAGVL